MRGLDERAKRRSMPRISAADREISRLHRTKKTVIARKGSCGLFVLLPIWTTSFQVHQAEWIAIKGHPAKSDSTNG